MHSFHKFNSLIKQYTHITSINRTILSKKKFGYSRNMPANDKMMIMKSNTSQIHNFLT